MWRSDLADWLISGVLLVAMVAAVLLGGFLVALVEGACYLAWHTVRRRRRPS